MNDEFEVLIKCPLFNDFTMDELHHITNCFNIKSTVYPSKTIILSENEQVNNIYIVIDGSLDVVKENYNGDTHLMMILQPSELFAEGIVCTKKRISPVTIIAKTDTRIVTIPYERIINTCTRACNFHTKIIYNMMLLLGEKNYTLNNKVSFLLLHGIKEKVVYYLLQQSKKQKSLTFTIPLSHTELAHFLNVSRPSMSRELGSLKKDKIIDYYKSSFTILDIEKLYDYI